MKYKKKAVTIEAITFDELVEHGLKQVQATANGMPWSFEYVGHQITHENDGCYLIPTAEGVMKMTRNDVLITGVAGEIYPCKQFIFEATYQPVVSEGLNFGGAIEALKLGHKVARTGWNGKGMWLSLSGPGVREIPAAAFWSKNNADYAASQPDGNAKVLPSITMKTATGEILMGWLASQTDMLAEDWVIVI